MTLINCGTKSSYAMVGETKAKINVAIDYLGKSVLLDSTIFHKFELGDGYPWVCLCT